MDSSSEVDVTSVNPLRKKRDYSGHNFSAEEKKSVAAYMIRGGVSASELCNDHAGLNESTVQTWKTKQLRSEFFKTARGRPESLDDEGFCRFDEAHDGTKTLPELKAIFKSCCQETKARKEQILPEESITSGYSKTAFFKYHKLCNSKPKSSQITTVARDREERDPRIFFTWAVLLHAYCRDNIPELVANWDATTFSCRSDDHNKLEVHVRVSIEQNTPLSRIGGSLSIYIKKIFLHNSAGQVAAPINVIADDTMDESSFECHKVPGLGNSDHVGNYGYLVFCKTRACNSAFYSWYAEHVVLAFMNDVRNEVGDRGMWSDGRSRPAFVSCDGDPSQVAVLMQPHIAQLFWEANTVLGKTPRSCSAVTQASDISDEFKAEKKVSKYSEYYDCSNPLLEHHLKNIFEQREQVVSTAGLSFTSEVKQLIMISLLQLSYAACVVINRKIVREGYLKFGQQGGNLNFMLILSACRSFISPAQKRLMLSRLEHFVDIMQKNHQISEKEMDEAGIVNVNRLGAALSEDLVVYRRRALVLSGDRLIEENLERHQRLQDDPRLRREKRIAAREERMKRDIDKAKAAVEKDRRIQERMEARALISKNKREASELKLMKKQRDSNDRRQAQAEAAQERAMLQELTPKERAEYKRKKNEQHLANFQAQLSHPLHFADEVDDDTEVVPEV